MPTASTRDLAGEAAILAAQLEASDSATVYTEVPGLDEAGAEAMLGADPPLHVEWDAVRGMWAVRAATEDEVLEAEAAAAAEAEATSAPPSGAARTTTSSKSAE
jgi:hypothetical protein